MSEYKWVTQFVDVIQQHITPKAFLGEEDATDEWAGKEKPINVFLHIDSYGVFKEEDSLFLFGRRGTGKTTLMQMLQYEVRKGELRNYAFAWIMSGDDPYSNLAIQMRTSPLSQLPPTELVYLLIKKWFWIFKTSAMAAVLEAHSEEPNKDISTISSYLSKQNLIDVVNKFKIKPLERLTDILVEELEAVEYVPTKVGAALAKITKRLFTPDFNDAEAALCRVLKEKGKCLVMVDAIEQYQLNDDISKSIVTALIEATRQMYTHRENTYIVVKVAFPSEIYPHLSSLNQEKVERKNIFILWRYRDLVSLLAKRYRQMLFKDKELSAYEKLEKFDNALGFLYQYLPKQVKTKSGIYLDTLAYIIRHTQKKPRQVILLMNVILTLSESQKIDFKKITEKSIVDGTHARLDILVKGALDMYEQIYPDAEQLVKHTLTRANSYFDSSSLDILLKETSSLRKKRNLSREDVKRLFLETGVIGIKGEEHRLTDPYKLWEALFEYQVKGTLAITQRSECVIHPMFYEDLQINVDMSTIIYPIPQEDEERKRLEEGGISLV